jgi:hypothetical protein
VPDLVIGALCMAARNYYLEPGVNRGEPGVTGADTVAAPGLEVIEKVQYQWRV